MSKFETCSRTKIEQREVETLGPDELWMAFKYISSRHRNGRLRRLCFIRTLTKSVLQLALAANLSH